MLVQFPHDAGLEDCEGLLEVTGELVYWAKPVAGVALLTRKPLREQVPVTFRPSRPRRDCERLRKEHQQAERDYEAASREAREQKEGRERANRLWEGFWFLGAIATGIAAWVGLVVLYALWSGQRGRGR